MTNSSNRITVVCSSPNGRGIDRYSQHLARALDAQLVRPEWRGFYVVWEVVGILLYLSILRRSALVIFANTRVSPLIRLAIRSKRVVVVVHDLMDTCFDGKRGDGRSLSRMLKERINTYLLKSSIEFADRVVCNSYSTMSAIMNEDSIKIEEEMVRVVYPPPSFGEVIEEARITSRLEERRAIRVIGVTGLAKNKAHESYFSLFSCMSERLAPTFQMDLFGLPVDGLEPDLRSMVKSSEGRLNTFYKADDTELLERYLDADFFVSLSMNEGFGMPLADALAFGIESVVLDIPAFREVRDMCRWGALYNGAPDSEALSQLLFEKCSELEKQKIDKEKRQKERVARYRAYASYSRKGTFIRLKEFLD